MYGKQKGKVNNEVPLERYRKEREREREHLRMVLYTLLLITIITLQ